ncbi:MAG: hypothetical protein LBO74_16960 [Candidatus Symbiothrix sp.]|jgi:hypothetical protein|nr:hypothetical protein [Candidatus Symbiothrix sp.]
MKRKIFIVFLSVFAWLGCEKTEVDAPEIASGIVGYWEESQYEESTNGNKVILYQRIDTFNENRGGIRFLNDMTLIERKNAGWCATPPIAYDNFNGKYQWEDNGTIIIDVAYWGGMEQRTWKIINLTTTILKIEILSQEIMSGVPEI